MKIMFMNENELAVVVGGNDINSPEATNYTGPVTPCIPTDCTETVFPDDVNFCPVESVDWNQNRIKTCTRLWDFI